MSNPLPPPLPVGTAATLSIAGRARAARIALTINLIFILVTAPLPLLVPDLDLGGPVQSMPLATQLLAALIGLTGCAGLISSIVAVVLYCLWIHRASRLAHRIARDMSYPPGWAVGWYFVPFANLVMPLRVMAELWRASHSFTRPAQHWRTAPASPIVGTWWALYLISGTLSGISSAMSFQGAPPRITSIIDVASSLLFVICGVFCLKIIRQLSAALSTAENAPPLPQPAPPRQSSADDAMFP